MEFNIINILFHAAVAIVIAVPCGKIHELIHVVVAKKLGYKINYIKIWKNEVDIAIEPSDPNSGRIARAPYYVMIPFSIILIWLGWHFKFLGVGVAGVGLLLMHIVTFKFEGREEDLEEIVK